MGKPESAVRKCRTVPANSLNCHPGNETVPVGDLLCISFPLKYKLSGKMSHRIILFLRYTDSRFIFLPGTKRNQS